MKRRLWPWFAGGFVVTFVLLAFKTVYVMLPSGEGVVGIPLWRHYLHEWPRAFQPRVIGPGSHSRGVLSWTMQHVLLSAIGGAVVLAVAWWLQRRKIAASSVERP